MTALQQQQQQQGPLHLSRLGYVLQPLCVLVAVQQQQPQLLLQLGLHTEMPLQPAAVAGVLHLML